VSRSGTECYDIHAKDGSKGDALLKLCSILEIDPTDTAAFGDANSDITMLRNVGIEFAMGVGERAGTRRCESASRCAGFWGAGSVARWYGDINRPSRSRCRGNTDS
jgi:3-deoxy-D-manno-octulosonate 8-phosphate phosphatase KdsC-like HAD superfamily phosphatase